MTPWFAYVIENQPSNKAKVDASLKVIFHIFYAPEIKVVWYLERCRENLCFILFIMNFSPLWCCSYFLVLWGSLEINTMIFTGYPGMSCLLHFEGKYEIIYPSCSNNSLVVSVLLIFSFLLYRLISLTHVVLAHICQYFFAILVFNRDELIRELISVVVINS